MGRVEWDGWDAMANHILERQSNNSNPYAQAILPVHSHGGDTLYSTAAAAAQADCASME